MSSEQYSSMASATKKRRYSSAPDLKVDVDGTLFEVHSQLLMLASPVFKAMLEADMNEADDGLMRLPGKCKAEFEAVYAFIGTLQEAPAIEFGSIPMLLRWADEYDIEKLRTACERELMKHEPSIDILQSAVQHGLADCRAKCIDTITSDLPSHIGALEAVVDDPAVMQHVLPALFNATNVLGQDVAAKRMTCASVKTLWPFVRATVLDALDAPFSSEPKLVKGEAVRVISNVARLRHLCQLSGVEWHDKMAVYSGEEAEIIKIEKSKYQGVETTRYRVQIGSKKSVWFTSVDQVLLPWSVLCPANMRPPKRCRS